MRGREKILLIEDDKKNALLMTALLMSRDYDVLCAETGKTAVSMAASHAPDLLLLNLGLPDMDGLDVLRKIREWSDIPILIVSARHGEREKVNGLDSGANDYITKPFGNEELLARIRAALRVSQRVKSSRTDAGYHNGSLKIDYEKRIVTMAENPVHMTPMEYRLLALFSQNTGKVLTHDYLLQKLWGPYTNDSQILRVNIANIRRKLEINPAAPAYIVTETGVGYRMKDLPE